MGLTLGILAAAAALGGSPVLDPDRLPALPVRGLALDSSAGVHLETMAGRPLGLLRGLRLAPDKTVSHSLVMRRGRLLFTLDVHAGRVRRYFEGPPPVAGCRLTDARIRRELWVCGRTVRLVVYGPPGSRPSLRTVARAPTRVGHWVWAGFTPAGQAVVAQWSAECELPIAFLVARGVLRPFGGGTLNDAPESRALGWLPDASAVIHFPEGACGSTFSRPGIYSIRAGAAPKLLLRTRRAEIYGMWGG